LKNPKHEAFAQAVASGSSGAAAYRDHVSGGKCSSGTGEVAASRLLKDGSKVALRIAELRAKAGQIADQRFSVRRESWLARLLGIADKAEAAHDFAAATRCLREIGLAMPGWYSPEKQQHDGKLEIVIRKL
jgi:hypothetical protein